MPVYTSTTYLEAINEILVNAGQRVINSLTSTPAVDKAVAILDSTNRQVQSKGWDFNTDTQLELQPDASNNIIVPQDTMTVDTVGTSKHIGVTLRDNVLRKTNRYDGADPEVFTTPVFVDLVHYLDFITIPQVARYYITIKAARRFADSYLASGTVHNFTAQEEAEALMDLKEAEGAEGDYNMLNSVSYIRRRTSNGQRF
jgi:hypothetical protein